MNGSHQPRFDGFRFKLSIGKMAFAGVDLYTNEAIAALSIKDEQKLEKRYLCYALRSFNVGSGAHTAAKGKVLNKGKVESLLIPLPHLREQRRIVEILDQADRLRMLRDQADKKAERILPALFIKMFGDPATNPKGWEVTTLEETGANVRYGLGQPPEVVENGLPLIRATNIKRGNITKEGLIFVNPASVPMTRNAFLARNEVIVVRSGVYTGDIAQVTGEWEGSVAGYDLVITLGPAHLGEFIESYLLTSFVQQGYFASLKSRAAQPHLNANQVKATPIYKPPIDFQERFAAQVNELRRDRKQRLRAEGQLENLFVVLLHKASTGALTRTWREAHMKELLAEMEHQTKHLNAEPASC